MTSHGYEVAKDGFGYRGLALPMTEGGSARIVIRRLNIAERLYRVTGAGIYRDSVLTGDRVPIREPLLNGQVLGQDSVLNAVYRDKIHWFWGDTNRPDYPLGNFHAPGATSELSGRGGLDPDAGVNLTYFLDDKGFARPTAPMPGDGPTWISGLVVLRDRDGHERMFANYVKIRNMLEVYQQGLVEFQPDSQRFEKVAQFPDLADSSGGLSHRPPLPPQGSGGRVRLLRQPLSADPRPGGSGAARRSRVVRVVHLPEGRHDADPSRSSTAARTARSATPGSETRRSSRRTRRTS